MRSVVITTTILVLLIGAWVYKTRAPIALSSPEMKTDSDSSKEPEIETGADSNASALSLEPTPNPTSEPSALQKILLTLSPADQKKLLVLDEIFKTKNDNDPRMDTELRELSGDLKRGMRIFYEATAPEKRNERGTMVFLMARSLCLPNTPQVDQVKDLEFLKSVLMEKPCRSLADCSRDAPAPSGEEEHLAGISETTANYPQLTALRQSLECYRKARGQTPPHAWLAGQLVQLLREAQGSPNPKVVDEARLILKYIGQ